MNEKVAEVVETASKFPLRKIAIGVAITAVAVGAAVLVKRKVDSEELEDITDAIKN